MLTGSECIARERKRQIEHEGWTKEHDSRYTNDELIKAAVCYALHISIESPPNEETYSWPWDAEWWKPADRLRNLIKAGALIAAEIDRIQES